MPITRSAIYQSLPGVSNKDKGTKRNADGRAVLGEITNKARSNILRNKQKVLTSRNQNLKSKPKLADKPKPKEEPVEYGTFEGHTDFMIVPVSISIKIFFQNFRISNFEIKSITQKFFYS